MTPTSILVVDIGGTSVKFAAIDNGRHRPKTRLISTQSLRDGDPVRNLARLIDSVGAEFGLTPEFVFVTIPGLLEPDCDLVRFAGNVPELNGRRLATELTELIGLPVALERDAVTTLQGEWRAGAGRGVRNLLGLFFGTGVGGAFLQDGRPFRGGGLALEIGNMPFRNEGRKLAGMRTDCLEAYVSGRALAVIARAHGVAIDEVFVRGAGNADLEAAIDAFVTDQALAIGMAIVLFSPDAVVLGGGVVEMKGFPMDRLSALVAAHSAIGDAGHKPDLRPAVLGWQAVVHGAEVTAAERFRSVK